MWTVLAALCFLLPKVRAGGVGSSFVEGRAHDSTQSANFAEVELHEEEEAEEILEPVLRYSQVFNSLLLSAGHALREEVKDVRMCYCCA